MANKGVSDEMIAAFEVPDECLLCDGKPVISAMFVPYNGKVRVWYSLCRRHARDDRAMLDRIELAIRAALNPPAAKEARHE